MGLNIAEHGATSSILELANTMNEMTHSGNFSKASLVKEEHGTEIGDLARLFNKMIGKIQIALKESQDQRALAEEMLRESELQKANVLKIQDELQLQREESNSQRSKFIGDTKNKVSQVNERIKGVTEYVSQTASVTREMNDSFTTLSETLEKMLNSLSGAHNHLSQVELITKESSSSADKTRSTVNDLKTVTREIQEMIGYINQIAEKTHVLSINSSIEAARAGKDGEGFVIISKEVRSLSRETSKTAGNIELKLTEVTNQVDRVTHSLEGILNIITDIADMNQQIIEVVDENRSLSQSVQQQSTHTSTTVKNVALDMERVINDTQELNQLSKSVELELEGIL